MFLDALGKWSLIDAYVLVLMLVAFQFRLAAPTESSVDAEMNVYVEPQFGFNSFLGATCLSLTLSHIILAYHRSAIKDETTESIQPDDRTPLCKLAFRNRFSRIGPVLITTVLIVSLGLICFGAEIPSFRFSFKGLTRLLLEFLHQPTSKEYSIVSLGSSIASASPKPDSFGIRVIQLSFYMFALVVPIMHLVSLLILWHAPLSHMLQRRLFYLTEVLNAWSAIDVLVIAIIAALLEIEQFAQFIIGGRCDLINEALIALDKGGVGASIGLHGEDQCFDVMASLVTGCWILFSACIFYLSATYVVMRTCHFALVQRRCPINAQNIQATSTETNVDDNHEQTPEPTDEHDSDTSSQPEDVNQEQLGTEPETKEEV